MTINTSTSFAEWKWTLPRRNIFNFNVPCTTGYANFDTDSDIDTYSIHNHPQLNNCLGSTLPLSFSSRSQHCHGAASAIFAKTAQPIVLTERLCMGINDASAGRCVTFVRAIDWSSTHLKPNAQSTTELQNWHLSNPSNSTSRRMVVWEELRAWQSFASVFYLCSVCFFNGLVFDGRCSMWVPALSEVSAPSDVSASCEVLYENVDWYGDGDCMRIYIRTRVMRIMSGSVYAHAYGRLYIHGLWPSLR